jgi:beta-galactosidase/beta-glucuronidase
MTRRDWINLNGLWDYAIQPMDLPEPVRFTGRILVPFPVESALSGVKKPVWKDERLWYRRSFRAPRLGKGKRLLLHFGAVDWETRVWVNGVRIGDHRGGYDAFTFDITDSLRPGTDNELVVAVFDATGSGQAMGKQNYNKFHKPASLAYTACSGIWQTVWLETVPAAHIESLKLIPDLAGSSLRISLQTSTPAPDADAEIIAYDGWREVGRVRGKPGSELRLPIQNPHPWTPSDPFLYTLKVRWAGDEVGSYFGMRSISLGRDAAGRTTMLLNGKPLFQVGSLDQGYWPDGNYTAPTDDALRWDLDQMKRLGFNMVRKHMKIEPERWFYGCDRLGLLVWQDMPSGGAGHGGDRISEGKRGDPAVVTQFETEMRAMVEQHGNHPSVVIWVLFNEGWGQYDTARITEHIKALDPSRIVNSASGWADLGTGDVNDRHVYPGPECPEPEPARAPVLGEFGGLGLATRGHTWINQSWGYKGVTDERSFTERYGALWQDVWKLHATQGLGAAVYTQWTDIETECNGLYTYDRKRLKLDAQSAGAAHRGLFTTPPESGTARHGSR